jgi:hypothetical protein
MSPALGRADVTLFIQGRLKFQRGLGAYVNPSGNAGGPSMLLGYGDEARCRLEACAIAGVRMYSKPQSTIRMTGQ